MKKIISLLLALALCLSLCACGGNTAPETTEAPTESTTPPAEIATEDVVSTETVPATEAGVADDVVCCTVTVSINPEFALHLNKNGLVLKLECLNEDAANALANADVAGMTADDAVAALLEEIYTYDSAIFEAEQLKVTIVVTMEESHEKLEQAVFRMDDKVFAFSDNHQIPLGYERRSALVMDKDSMTISDSIDENGNRVVVEVDGDGIEWKTISSAETGAMIELIRTDPDGTVTHSDMVTGTTTTTKPDGTTSQNQGVIGKG